MKPELKRGFLHPTLSDAFIINKSVYEHAGELSALPTIDFTLFNCKGNYSRSFDLMTSRGIEHMQFYVDSLSSIAHELRLMLDEAKKSKEDYEKQTNGLKAMQQ